MISKAIAIARQLPHVSGRTRVVAICSDKRGRILSVGINSYEKTSPTMYYLARYSHLPMRLYWHAECKALSQVETAYKITIARIDAHNQPRLARPCDLCTKYITSKNVKVVEYTT